MTSKTIKSDKIIYSDGKNKIMSLPKSIIKFPDIKYKYLKPILESTTPGYPAFKLPCIGNSNCLMKAYNGNIKGVKILTRNMRKGLLDRGDLSYKSIEVFENVKRNKIRKLRFRKNI